MSESVIDHAIHNVKPKFGYTMLVQCTSPLTEAEDFTNLIKTVEGKDSAAYYTRNYSFCFDLDDEDLRLPRLPRQVRDYRTQEAGNAWIF